MLATIRPVPGQHHMFIEYDLLNVISVYDKIWTTSVNDSDVAVQW